MRIFGYIVLAASIGLTVLHFTGHLVVQPDVEMTEQGRQTYNQGLDKMQRGINDSLGHLKAQSAAKE